MRFLRLLSLLSFVVLLAHSPLASVRAQPSSADRVLATDLFQRGRAALVAGAYAEACPLLEESQRLDPAGGTLLNLALCHEQIGRVATAWSEFLEGLSVARREHREDRVRYAREHITALEARLSRLVVQVEPASELPGMSIERDGTALGRYAWGVATPVDPGEHTVRVRAPGYQELTQTVVVKDGADLVTVVVPPLLAEPPTVAAPPMPTEPPPVVVAVPSQSEPVKPAPTAPAPGTRRKRRAALSLLGVSAVAAVAATVCGLRALTLRGRAEDNCEDGRCSEAAFDQNDRARRNADASTVLAVLSGVSGGAGLWLWLVREPRAEQARLAGAGVGFQAGF